MTLKQAREIGRDCGLTTDEECVRNIDIHCTMLFKYSEMFEELEELYKEYEESKNGKS